MNRNIKAKYGLRCLSKRKTLVFASLLFIVAALCSSLFAGMFLNCSSGAFWDNVVHVKNESELKNAIDNASSSKETIIALDNDITLTESAITIPYNKDITLTSDRSSGFYKLISGVASEATIYVDGGALKIDGIIVSGGSSSGIHVSNKGVLVMYDGEISDNSAFISGFNPFGYVGVGGGVRIDSGVFEMYGGKISNNRAQGSGGGVRTGLGGAVFSMFGGEISGNTAEYGGGVYIGGDYANFSWVGGVISGNTTTIEGNDVYPSGSGGGSSGGSDSGDNGPSNGSNGSSGNGGGSGSNGGNSGLSNGNGYNLRDIVIICVCVVGVVCGILSFYFRSKMKHLEEKLNKHVEG
ncbi:MAG: hypothetical protein LBB87_03525 [Nitrososphaerota archaeon]|jgi:hypothetical protein|nr:hypothetical protein [Nitrososphaerota archaeon]